MALLAGYRPVQADEGEAGQVMIEDDALIPLLLVMAACTTLAFLALMNVVVFVAGEAAGAFLFLNGVAAMAVLAGDLFM